jgi:hypothetical protein
MNLQNNFLILINLLRENKILNVIYLENIKNKI